MADLPVGKIELRPRTDPARSRRADCDAAILSNGREQGAREEREAVVRGVLARITGVAQQLAADALPGSFESNCAARILAEIKAFSEGGRHA